MTTNSNNTNNNNAINGEGAASGVAPAQVTAHSGGAGDSTTVALFDDNTSQVVGVASPPGPMDYIRQGDESLAQYFRRPVVLNTYTWDSTAFASAEFNPWSVFLSNAYVKKKLDNYALFRGTLHVRALFDGTPLQAGALQMSYMPCRVLPAVEPKSNRPLTGWDIYRGSQLRNVEIYGNGTSSGELVCPFLFYKPFASIVSTASDMDHLGRLRIQQLIGLYSSAEAAVVSGTLQIVAWMEDIELRVATYLNTMQKSPVSSAELSAGFSISRPATIVAKAAGLLSGLPIIGPFATTASMVASGVASIASAFGFSRPAAVGDSTTMIPRYTGRMAITSGIDACEKLSTDPKQGVSIGPGWIGLPPGPDPLAIQSIATRESLMFTSTSWSTTTAVGTSLFAAPVHPFVGLASTALTACRLTPMAFAAAPFKYWGGSIHLRIKAIVPGMSRGRLLIYHYPHNDANYESMSYTDVLSTCQNCILDLESSTDVEFVIRPAQSTPWLEVGLASDLTTWTGDAIERANGRIVVRVMNKLSAPLASYCGLLFYVRAGSDFQVATPALSQVQGWKFVNTMMKGSDTSVPTTGPGGANAPAELCDLSKRGEAELPVEPYFGERIQSLRSMAKRFSFYTYTRPQFTAATPASTTQIAFNVWGDFYGYIPRSLTGSIIWAWPQYVMMPFLATRGGMRWRAQLAQVAGATSATAGARFGFVRSGTDGATAPGGSYETAIVTYSLLGYMRALQVPTGDGACATPQERQPFAEAEFPYQSPLLYSYPGSLSMTYDRHPDVMQLWCVAGQSANVTKTDVAFDVYTAAADDFTCDEWIGCGTIDVSGTAPALTGFFLSV